MNWVLRTCNTLAERREQALDDGRASFIRPPSQSLQSVSQYYKHDSDLMCGSVNREVTKGGILYVWLPRKLQTVFHSNAGNEDLRANHSFLWVWCDLITDIKCNSSLFHVLEITCAGWRSGHVIPVLKYEHTVSCTSPLKVADKSSEVTKAKKC